MARAEEDPRSRASTLRSLWPLRPVRVISAPGAWGSSGSSDGQPSASAEGGPLPPPAPFAAPCALSPDHVAFALLGHFALARVLCPGPCSLPCKWVLCPAGACSSRLAGQRTATRAKNAATSLGGRTRGPGGTGKPTAPEHRAQGANARGGEVGAPKAGSGVQDSPCAPGAFRRSQHHDRPSTRPSTWPST